MACFKLFAKPWAMKKSNGLKSNPKFYQCATFIRKCGSRDSWCINNSLLTSLHIFNVLEYIMHGSMKDSHKKYPHKK